MKTHIQKIARTDTTKTCTENTEKTLRERPFYFSDEQVMPTATVTTSTTLPTSTDLRPRRAGRKHPVHGTPHFDV